MIHLAIWESLITFQYYYIVDIYHMRTFWSYQARLHTNDTYRTGQKLTVGDA